MSVTWLEALGLIGVTLVIAKGSIFNPLRDFLKSFEHRLNPLPWLGELISCAMCFGVWVGFVWGVFRGWSFPDSILFGGAVSVASLIMGGFVDILALERDRRVQKSNGSFTLADLLRARQGAKANAGADKLSRPKTRIGEEVSRMPTEDEADQFLEDHNQRADVAS